MDVNETESLSSTAESLDTTTESLSTAAKITNTLCSTLLPIRNAFVRVMRRSRDLERESPTTSSHVEPLAVELESTDLKHSSEAEFESFLLKLFRLNSADEAANIECDKSARECVLMINHGPHTPLRLDLATGSLLEILFNNNFRIARSTDKNRPEIRCAYVVKCHTCGIELFDTSSLLVVIFNRWEIMCKLFQQSSCSRSYKSNLHLQNTLLHQMKHQHPSSLFSYRRQLERVLLDIHKLDCVNKRRTEGTVNLLDSIVYYNKFLSSICATCLFEQIELELRIYIGIYNTRFNEDTSSQTCRLDVTCRCCFRNRAQLNFPCGHVFQCELCKLKLRESLMSRLGQVVHEPPCPICRACVITTVDVYD